LDIRDPFFEVTANSTVTTEAPHWHFSRRGRIPGKGKCPSANAYNDASFAGEVEWKLSNLMATLRAFR
jgi:hypothetical protein